MAAGITIIDRVIIAVAILVQAVGGFWVEVGGIIRGDESAPLGGVIPGVAIIQTGFSIVDITATTKMRDWNCIGNESVIACFLYFTTVYLQLQGENGRACARRSKGDYRVMLSVPINI